MTVTVSTRPQYLNANTNVYTAWDLRRMFDASPGGEGVAGYEDFRVMQRQAGANMSVDVGKTAVGLMQAWVRGDARGGQGLYAVDNIDRSAPTADTYVAQLNDTITSNASGNPRLDQVVLEVLDQQHSGASNLAQVRVVAGTPTAAATLDNRNGAASLPANCLLLADVLVSSGAASIVTADIRDRRAFCLPGTVPPLTTDVDMVAFLPGGNRKSETSGGYYQHNSHDTMQSAALMFLPRRIVSATRIRWRYTHSGTANTGNYNIGIYDASGRQIVTTGAVAFTGALNTIQTRSETITATTFDAGYYYVLAGWDTATAGATSGYEAFELTVLSGTNDLVGAGIPNVGFRASSGGTTLPTTLLAMTDVTTLSTGTNIPAVPMIALSVG